MATTGCGGAARCAAAPLVVLLVPDPVRSAQVAALCRRCLPGVRCVECGDELGVAFAVPHGRASLVLVDADLAFAHNTAWLTNLRRQAPQGQLLLVDAASDAGLAALGSSLQRRQARGS